MKRLAVFARWPVPGRVKTRLSPALPPDIACDLHRAMLQDALAAALASGAEERWLWWADAPGTGGRSDPAPAAGLPGEERFVTRSQHGAHLGERLRDAFSELLASPGDRAVIIGADCPSLGASDIDAAFAALETREIVIAPARDGGYALIGLARQAPDLFHGIPWSTAAVLDETVRRARAAGLEPLLLPALEDLDTPEALVRWIGDALLAGRESAAATAALLRAIGLMPSAG